MHSLNVTMCYNVLKDYFFHMRLFESLDNSNSSRKIIYILYSSVIFTLFSKFFYLQ